MAHEGAPRRDEPEHRPGRGDGRSGGANMEEGSSDAQASDASQRDDVGGAGRRAGEAAPVDKGAAGAAVATAIADARAARDAQDAAAKAERRSAAPGERGTRRAPVRLAPQKTKLIDDVATAASASERHVTVQAPRESTRGREGFFGDAAEAESGAATAAAPANPWEQLGIDPRLARRLYAEAPAGLGFTRPTRPQRRAIPTLLSEGRDVIVKADTGSGKTLTFLLPIIHSLLQRGGVKRADGTRAVILAPTRELAVQTYDVLCRLAQPFPWLVAGCLSGGEKRKSEKARLRKGVVVVVSTPGRLLDHLTNTRSFFVAREGLQWLVLDEADRLMDMGFEAQVAAILTKLGCIDAPSVDPDADMEYDDDMGAGGDADADVAPSAAGRRGRPSTYVSDGRKQARSWEGGAALHRQSRPKSHKTVLCSATVGSRVRKLAGMALRDPVKIDANAGLADDKDGDDKDGDDPSRTLSTPVQLSQHYVTIPAKWRLVTLFGLLRKLVTTGSSCRVVVFFATCASVDFHHALLRELWSGLCAPPKGRAALQGKKGAGKGAGDADDVPSTTTTGLYKLHGEIAQADRLAAFRSFGSGTRGVLLATDVAARGLDLPAVSCIVQFDAPQATSEYVHRVGRSARRGLTGQAILFLMPNEVEYVTMLKDHGLKVSKLTSTSLLASLRGARPAVDALREAADAAVAGGGGAGGVAVSQRARRLLKAIESGKDPRRKGGAGGKGGGKAERGGKAAAAAAFAEVEAAAVEWQSVAEETVAVKPELHDAAVDAFSAFVRAYATHSGATKRVFVVRALHLGHLAKSFGLLETPARINKGARGKDAKGAAKAAANVNNNNNNSNNHAAVARGGGGGGGDGGAEQEAAKADKRARHQGAHNRQQLQFEGAAGAGAAGARSGGIKKKASTAAGAAIDSDSDEEERQRRAKRSRHVLSVTAAARSEFAAD